jgi:osmoprotectant transport system substrate-binding protein
MKRMAEVMTKVLAGLIAAIGFAVSVHVPTACASTIVVGGKGFTEQLLLAEITAQLLKARGFKVDKRDGMGSQVVRDAQINGQVDVYWEYTGTSLVIYNKYKQAKGRLTAEDAYEKVKELDAKRGLTWLKPSAANNTFALAVRASDARTDGLKTLSDLARAYNDKKGLIMAVGAEFPWRSDGLPGMEKAYGFKTTRADLKAMDPGLTYLALKKDLVDAAVVFATDGRIEAFNFRILADDKGFFQNYALVPVIRTETLEANPKLAEPLNALSAKLNDAVMRRLNAEVDVQHKPIKAVAAAFLKSVGLI